MKKILMLLLNLLPFFLMAQGIQFDTKSSWSEILKQAKTENKYIFVDCFATNCIPCKMMDQQVLSSPEVGTKFKEKEIISVKVQFDQTPKDDAYVRSWYADVKQINDTYRILSYPTYLFLTPEGELIYRITGFNPVKEFIAEVNLATDPKRKLFVKQLADYNRGKKDYVNMPKLIADIKNILRDKEMAKKMSIDFKVNYLDKVPTAQLCNKENILFLKETMALNFVVPGNRYFDVFFKTPKCADTIEQGLSEQMVRYAIEWNDIRKVLWKKDGNSNPITLTPDWSGIYSSVSKNYGEQYAVALLPRVKEEFFVNTKNWEAYTKYVDDKINGKETGNTVTNNRMNYKLGELSTAAWNLFWKCADKKYLEKGLEYIDLSIKGYGDKANAWLYHTKANLLHKLGRSEEGITWEEKTIAVAEEHAKANGQTKVPLYKEYTETLLKMKAGLPTWSKY